jgi:FtsP/CotA-like multicopper oxidase with cupredoxin domain
VALTRRDLIKAGVFAGATLSLPLSRVVSGQSALANRMPAGKLPKPFTTAFAAPPVAVPFRSDDTTDYYRMSMSATPLEVIPGYRTMFFAYEGAVPGPTIKVDQGRRVVVRHRNTLPSVHPTLGYEPWTSVHLHGSASLPQFDGYASDITHPGQFKDYDYPNLQAARTMWYHDHGVFHTAENAYHGLAAQYHLYDALEQSLPIPHGRYDVPLMFTDALFNNDGSLLFTLEDESGLWGDVILVNGRPWPVMQVERRKYRFRLLGCAVSRSWNLSLDSGEPLAVIATDGGLMPAPQFVKRMRVASSERYEVIIDFSKYPIGRRVILKNSSPKNNRDFANTDKIMAFDVISDPTDLSNNSIPDVLNPDDIYMNLRPQDSVRTRRFRFERDGGEWKINGKSWDDVVRSNYQFTLANPRFGDIEIWEFENSSGGWFHPVHAHLIDFKILDRNGRPPFPHEVGPKDVVYVGEGEKVRVITKFGEGRGKYMMHCHNLIHEDHDMMAQFEVIDPQQSGEDPLGTLALPLSEEGAHPL